MATYDIAPATTGSEIGMAQMRYGLHNKEDYNAANLYTAGAISLRTISQFPDDYQSELVSQTWNTASPYGFDELAGQTWSTLVATLSFSFSNNISIYSATATLDIAVRLGSSTGTILYTDSLSNQDSNTGTVFDPGGIIESGDTIYVSATATYSSPYSLTGEYRVPNSGTYSSLFFQSSGPSGGTLSQSVTFVITYPNTSSGIVVSI